eukprot:355418-Chlamydomonas_euryale.AAC.4
MQDCSSSSGTTAHPSTPAQICSAPYDASAAAAARRWLAVGTTGRWQEPCQDASPCDTIGAGTRSDSETARGWEAEQ